MNPVGQPHLARLERRAPARLAAATRPQRAKRGLGAPIAWVLTLALLLALPTASFAAGRVLYDAPKAVELGRELSTQLRATTPATSFTNTGTLYIKAKRQPLVKVAYTCRVTVTPTNWTSYYSAVRGTNSLPGFSVEHRAGQPGIYRDDAGQILSGRQLDVPFAGSDFWLSDLGLEYFHWPDQRVPRWEMARSAGCKVLESKNPSPAPTGYSKVVSWIHDESGGIVQAHAYDARGELLKEFRPTELEKVNGQHELKELEIENVRTKSVTRLEFDL
jgi:hypothetical protein